MSQSACRNVTAVTVAADLCCGCGVCAGVCPSHNLRMDWTPDGAYAPTDTGQGRAGCTVCGQCCPFTPDADPSDDALAAARFGAVPDIAYLAPLGYHLGCYVGHVATGDYRAAGASGGMARWFLAQLLQQGLVDRVVSVVARDNPEQPFAFALAETPEAVRAGCASVYHPVEISALLTRLLAEPARYAVIALPCVHKALALAERVRPQLAERLVWRVGLACGHMKSRHYTRYLTRSLGADEAEVAEFVFREKREGKAATNYQMSACLRSGERRSALVRDIAPLAWTRGDFKLRACTFCDDLFAELADVAFMDASMPAYHREWRGTSAAVTRSPAADALIREAIAAGALAAAPLSAAELVASKQSTLRRKRVDLAGRLWLARRAGEVVPRKRVDPQRPALYDVLRLQTLERFRRATLAAMRAQLASGRPGLDLYRARLRWPETLVSLFTTRERVAQRLRRRPSAGSPGKDTSCPSA
jgi:coenzyme F420 hydrogenase subunit beta